MEFKRRYWRGAHECDEYAAQSTIEEEAWAWVKKTMRRWASEEEEMSIDTIRNNLRRRFWALRILAARNSVEF
jgi:hypothetical protein